MINEAKQMPQAVEAENAVIGALMLDSRSFAEIESIVAIDDFYLEKNRILFETISNINRNRGVVDMITVMQELIRVGKLDDIGGAFAISELSTMVSSSNHIKYHAQIVKDKAIARRIITLTSLVQDKAFEQTGDISETVEFLEKSITEVNTNTSEISSITLADAIKKSTDKAAEIQSLREKGIDISIKTGLTELNREFNGGFRAPDLIIIGGRPSMGKALPMNAKVLTSKGFVLNKDLKIGDSVASIDGKRSIVTGIYPQGVIKTYEIEFSDGRKMECCGEHLWEVNSNEFIDKSKVLTTLQIKSILNDKSFKGKLDIMFIDYLGLIRTNMKFGTRDLEIGYITGELKNLAKELNIPIVLLSQLSRPPKGISVKEPQLEDLRESGNIEQDADVVMFIHRPSYYDPTVTNSLGESWDNKGKLIISKYREGARNRDIIFKHDDAFKKIFDDDDNSKPIIPENFKRVNYSEPDAPLPF